MTTNRRRARPADEWVPIRKDTISSPVLEGGGKIQPGRIKPLMAEEQEIKLPKVQEAETEEITLPHKCADAGPCQACEVKQASDGMVPVQKPMPHPAGAEERDKFLSRCMGDPVMNRDFPDQKQRYAVCNTQWTDTKKAEEKPPAAPFEGAPAGDLQTDAPPDKTVDEPEQEAASVALMLMVPNVIAKSLAIKDGSPPEDMHVTLGYLGKLGKDVSPDQIDIIHKCASMTAKGARPMPGHVSGVGRFAGMNSSDGKDVVYASVDVPGLAKFRTGLVAELEKCSAVIKSDHDFTPHITLAYVNEADPSPVHKLARQPVEFTHLVLAVGKERREMALGQVEQVQKAMWVPIVKSDGERRLITGIVLQPEVTDAQGDIISKEVIEEAAHNFLANYNRKTQMGHQHKYFPEGIHLVESYITPADLEINGKSVRQGSWVMTTYVANDDLWNKVKSGAIRGYSIGGLAKVQRLAVA